MSYRKLTLICTWKAMNTCKDLVYVMFQISSVGSGSWSIWSYFRKYYVRLNVKWSAIHCKGSQKITSCATVKKKLSLKGSQFCWKSYAKSFIPIGFHPIIHLMMSVGLKFIFNHLPHPLNLHICTSFSFTFAMWMVHIISIWLDVEKHLQIDS